MRGNYGWQNNFVSFDRIAPYYHFLERVCAGSLMQRCRVAHLSAVRNAKKVLIAGEGTGRFLAECAIALPEAEFTVLDASEAMLRLAERRWNRAGAASFVRMDLRDWKPTPRSYDLIVTHYFLDCFSKRELPLVIKKLACAAAPDACWLLADFRQPPHGLAKWRARLVLFFAYAFFRYTARLKTRELTPPDQLLLEEGFLLTKRDLFDWDLMHSDLWSRVS